ncbi:MAG: hypothetical protein ACJ8HI_13750 [Massilia sp.]|jgi:hypothetical protein
MPDKLTTARSVWHQFLDAQDEIRGTPAERPHDCSTMEHVYEGGVCVACGEAEFDDE